MTSRSTARTPGSRRPRATAVLITLLAALALSLVPGSASAAGTVTPLAECYTSNSDGTWSVVLGYTNNSSRTVTIATGSNNSFSPSGKNSSLPTTFKSGTQHSVARVVLTNAELNQGASWYLDGTRVSASSGLSPCTASQLPMLANGAAVVGLVVIAGVIGAVVVRRQRRLPGLELAGRG